MCSSSAYVYDLLNHGKSKILAVVPQLILPIQRALQTRDTEVIATVLKILQAMIQAGNTFVNIRDCLYYFYLFLDSAIGVALVPYYRQLLPTFNLLKNHQKNIGDKIDYSQRLRLDVGELIDETLQLFDKHGGENAYINIKYMVPTYENSERHAK
ncbi:hypothetical protein IE077_002600 [Cardiosporidium cionae]|uniref:Uncharacterized protein n=1 Tax=Cardiosporidium cionae TaxID=476202 RepID=A0ABQ7JAF4_9APIC|nr:hypothetical protein IE077_002600 [Cardiosporidium cionae]|eukprot:KAF8820972.1 hypothetical protein IE077_002600 [Cardiosporidium cionae]